MTITSLGFSTQPARLQQLQEAMFKTADADGDGQLSLSEFQSVGQNVQGQGERRGPPPMRGGEPPAGRFGTDTLSALLSTQSVDDVAASVMEAGDADGDGLLSAEELSSALSANAPSDAPADASGKMAADILSALDTDGDGGLSTAEISTAISNAAAGTSSSAQAMRGPPPGPPPSGGASSASGSSSSSGVFESLDTNQDGVVSAEELAAADGAAEASGAASDLIGTADQDGDGALSGGEFYALLEEGQKTTASTDTTVTLASLISGSSAAADLMQKLLAQLDSALTASSTTATAGTGVDATA
ncbi:EF-hand domain-containing protein [Caulobacter sp. SL161]|uniref:EF-hand domain-containing protein n=1 Tax=Caulobacter sp. SL161 TaxID=2995156 RepID=UPI0022729C92|nr:EF-hand domain-containing protein [Caulobacter sp. SL161]MCY1648056.1 EF-hand domain-containing protein [Caulobacter sp. SL161]